MVKKKGHDKNDKYYLLAKEQGYRSRAAFKLIQINRKYGFLQTSRRIIDLCAAPGGWSQVCVRFAPSGCQVIGLDLLPIRPIKGVTTYDESQGGDITSAKCRSVLKRDMRGELADTIVCDGAPNVGGGAAWSKDAYGQNELILVALKLTTEHLRKGGVFVTKVFRSRDYNSLLWVLKQLFAKVDAVKPKSSRSTSAEIFLVCSDYYRPKKIDPRLLNPKYVFGMMEEKKSAGADVFHKKVGAKVKRNREGYDDDMPVHMHKAGSVLGFLTSKTEAAIGMLGKYHTLAWKSSHMEGSRQKASDEALMKAIREWKGVKEVARQNVEECLKDLQVLGKADFKVLMKWRDKVKDFIKEYRAKEREQEESESRENMVNGDDDMTASQKNAKYDVDDNEDSNNKIVNGEKVDSVLQEKELEIQLATTQARIKKAQARREKKRRRQHAKLQRRIDMKTAGFMAQEGGSLVAEDDGVFSISDIKSKEAMEDLVAGKRSVESDSEESDQGDSDSQERGGENSSNSDSDSDENEQDLEADLDDLYKAYRTRISERTKMQETVKSLQGNKSGKTLTKRKKKMLEELQELERKEKEYMESGKFQEEQRRIYLERISQSGGDQDDEEDSREEEEEEEEDESSDAAVENSPSQLSSRQRELIRSMIPSTVNSFVEDSDDEEESNNSGGEEEEYVGGEDMWIPKSRTNSVYEKAAFKKLKVGEMPKTDREIRKAKRKRELRRKEKKEMKEMKKQKLMEGLGKDEKANTFTNGAEETGKHKPMDLSHLTADDLANGSSKFEVVSQDFATKRSTTIGRNGNSNGNSNRDVNLEGRRYLGFEDVEETIESVDDDAYAEKKGDDSDYLESDDESRARTLAMASQFLLGRDPGAGRSEGGGYASEKRFVDASYNRFMWNDPEALPDWFVEDERKFYRPAVVLSKSQLDEQRARFMDLQAAPIKKVAEARIRKRKRAMLKLQKAKQQANAIVASTELTERAKMRAIEKLMKRAERGSSNKKNGKNNNHVYVVASGGGQTRTAQRSLGMKVNKNVKLVDKRMKADKRGMRNTRRKAKKRQKKRNKNRR